MAFTIEIINSNIYPNPAGGELRNADFAISENASDIWYRDRVDSLSATGDLQTILDGMAADLFVVAEVPSKLVPAALVEGYRYYKNLNVISRAVVSLNKDIANAVALNTLLFNAITILNESSFLFTTFNNERIGLGITGTITTQAGINALTPSPQAQRQLEQILRNSLNSFLAGAVSARVEAGL